MKRNEWQFEIAAEKLAAAAKAKVELHAGRLEFWKQAQTETMAECREKGLSVETSLAGDNYSSGSNVRSARARPQIMVDATYQRKLDEAAGKVDEHIGKVHEYEGWVQVLEGNGGRMYPLNADDYLYFFGK